MNIERVGAIGLESNLSGGHASVGAKVTLNYLEPIKRGTEYQVTSKITEVTERKVKFYSEVRDTGTGVLYATSEHIRAAVLPD